ncbi:MAG: glutathione S-transferase N-terminal domain-containing protein [Moraxella osloensis]
MLKVKELDINDIHNLQVINVDIGKNEQNSPEFLAVNPLGLLPVLVLDDGTVLNDSHAICTV